MLYTENYMNRFLLLLTVFVILLCTSSCQLTHNDITNLPIDIVSPDFEYIEIDDKPYDYNYVVGANQLQYSDGYLYCYDSIISDKNKTLKKIDIKTGIVTSVCSDPICLHNSPECPIFGIANAFFVHNNNVFFMFSFCI